MCVCVCVRERERERESVCVCKGETDEREREIYKKERVCVWGCVCTRVSMCVSVSCRCAA